MSKQNAILMGPFVGELYWEAGRFAPILPKMVNKDYRNNDIKFIILTRKERFDLYGKYADILIPLRIPGDYIDKQPNCFRLNNFKVREYEDIAKNFFERYQKRYKVIRHIYPNINKSKFVNKNQFPRSMMQYSFRPRNENYEIIKEYLPTDKPLVVLAPRFRKGFKRNWSYWPEFYDKVANDKQLMNNFNFIICGKEGEYIPDVKNRFYDMNHIKPGVHSSIIGFLLVILENAFFTFGSQSAIPNLSLLYKVDVLEFGCQRMLHTKTYNIHNSPITFIDDKTYSISIKEIFPRFKDLLNKKRRSENAKDKK